jgi:bacterioferritin
MAEPNSAAKREISRDRLAELLNEDLSREYQAIIAYVVYSQVLSGAQYMDIAAQLEIHAKQELDHALILSRQIDYLGKMPVVTPKPVRTSKNPKDMLQYDLDNENETIRNYRDRIRQCEALGEYAMAEQIRQILMQEQDHQIDLATALGIEVPDVTLDHAKIGCRRASPAGVLNVLHPDGNFGRAAFHDLLARMPSELAATPQARFLASSSDPAAYSVVEAGRSHRARSYQSGSNVRLSRSSSTIGPIRSSPALSINCASSCCRCLCWFVAVNACGWKSRTGSPQLLRLR